MLIKANKFSFLLKKTNFIIAISLFFVACKPNKSSVTGWEYNNKKNAGSYQVSKVKNIKTAPGLVFIPGGTFTMGAAQEDITMEWDNIPRRVTVNSFFIDKTEVSNLNYREYVHWMNKTFTDDRYVQLLTDILPDTLVWREELGYNEPMVENYFRHPSFNNYPVVGISWIQAHDFCLWRTDRVNENELIKYNVINKKDYEKTNINNRDEDNFNTRAYLMGLYRPRSPNKNKKFTDSRGKPRAVNKDDGILYGEYRLPTEAEWEYAAYGYVSQNPQRSAGTGTRGEELIKGRQVYAWKNDGYNNLRYTGKGVNQGAFLANFKRGNGDNMGVAGGLNDRAATPADVNAYFPNSFGLYNMSGNVSEWVADTYRPMTPLDGNDYNYYRGNVFKVLKKDSLGEYVVDSLGRLEMELQPDSTLKKRRNYQKAYAIDYNDGDTNAAGPTAVYRYGITTLISDKSKVIKGGSWNDRPFWLSPGSRRYMQEEETSSTVGFRCAMSHFGAPEAPSFSPKSGNSFPKRKQKR